MNPKSELVRLLTSKSQYQITSSTKLDRNLKPAHVQVIIGKTQLRRSQQQLHRRQSADEVLLKPAKVNSRKRKKRSLGRKPNRPYSLLNDGTNNGKASTVTITENEIERNGKLSQPLADLTRFVSQMGVQEPLLLPELMPKLIRTVNDPKLFMPTFPGPYRILEQQFDQQEDVKPLIQSPLMNYQPLIHDDLSTVFTDHNDILSEFLASTDLNDLDMMDSLDLYSPSDSQSVQSFAYPSTYPNTPDDQYCQPIDHDELNLIEPTIPFPLDIKTNDDAMTDMIHDLSIGVSA